MVRLRSYEMSRTGEHTEDREGTDGAQGSEADEQRQGFWVSDEMCRNRLQ